MQNRQITIKKNTEQVLTELEIDATQIVVEEGAQLDLICLQSTGSTQKIFKTITLKDNAVARVFTGLFDSVDITITGVMEGNHSTYENHVMYFGIKHQSINMLLNAEHIGKNTMSRTLVRGVALENAHADFAGSINIHQTGGGADGYLQHEGLLLSKKARIDSLPGLEVGTDDVKASHGSAVHYIRPEQLFYLQSRGIGIPEAKKLIVSGFLEEMLATVRESSMLKQIHSLVDERKQLI